MMTFHLRGLSIACASLGLLTAFGAVAAPSTTTLKAAAVASPDRYGALAAQSILREGGNAVDAAVATAFTLAVSYPEAGNIGGGGFMTLFVKGQPYFLDYREAAPAAASANMYLDSDGKPTDKSLYGNLAVGIPGTVRGMAEAHKRFGKLTWQQDLAPAIELARAGFDVPEMLIRDRDQSPAGFPRSGNFAAWAKEMHRSQRFRQPELAKTLERIAKGGADEFYSGVTAERIVAQMSRGPVKGLITREDLARYKAVWREPLAGEWHGFRVITAPPPSSGGIALLQMLEMKADAAKLFADVTLNSPQYVHLVAEIEKRVYADRAAYLGDPDSIKIPVAQLLAPEYVARRAAEINPTRPSATASARAGLEKPQTTHFSIIDRDGNAVSNTYTLNGEFGAGVIVEGDGFLLNDEMDDFSAKPGAPNYFGVVGAEANAIAAGRRPLSSMTPTILLRGGVPAMVIGTPGGSRIFTSVFQVLVNAYEFHLPLAAAVAAPRYHHQLLPADTIFTEPYAPAPQALKQALERLGYRLEQQGFNGDIAAIEIEKASPRVAADPRGRGVSLIVAP
jgi:gamma-glutamyltranspeptidase / glutathione hydrolase